MKILPIVAVLILFNPHLWAQKTDPEIFDSDFEKTVFKNFVDSLPVKEIDLLNAFRYDPANAANEKAINFFCDELKAKGILNNKRKKLINEIFEKVHERFLKKYEAKAYFNDIFTSGNYNCVTASALYTLVLDYFNIDYQIKETPDHVFLIADPYGTSFMIETTLPSGGVTVFDDRFKKNYVDYLLENKLISSWEYKSNSLDDLFEKYYATSKSINKLQLASLQYYNQGVFSYDEKNFKESAANFEKTNIVHPSANIKFLLNSALLNLLLEQSSRKKYDGKTLAKYTNLNRSSDQALGISKQFFTEVSNELAINHPDIKGYEKFYNDFISNLTDSVDKKDYMQAYNEEMTYYYYLKNDYGKVFYYAGISYTINPDNIKNQQFVQESFFKYLQDPEVVESIPLDTVLNYTKKFPFFLNNSFFQQFLAFEFLRDVIEAEPGNKQALVSSIYKLQQFSRKVLLLPNGSSIVETLYTETSSQLVRNQMYDQAETVLKNGLELIPDSENFKSRLKTIASSKESARNYAKSGYSAKVPAYQYITPPPYKVEEVNASIKKYIGKCWNVDFYKKDGKTKEVKVEQLKFIFYPDNKMKFKTGTEEHWGTWKINPSGPTLTLKSNEDQQQFSILVYEASATQMRGIMSPNTYENKKIEFNTCEK